MRLTRNLFSHQVRVTLQGRIFIHPQSLKSLAPFPCEARAGLVRSTGRAFLKSLPNSLPASPSWGEGILRGLGGGIKMRPLQHTTGWRPSHWEEEDSIDLLSASRACGRMNLVVAIMQRTTILNFSGCTIHRGSG